MSVRNLKEEILDLHASCVEIMNQIAESVQKGEPPNKFELETAEVHTLLCDFVSEFNNRKEIAAKKICNNDLVTLYGGGRISSHFYRVSGQTRRGPPFMYTGGATDEEGPIYQSFGGSSLYQVITVNPT
ncbi:hypothetical protein EJ06DRAFT_64806 [Trichodelitschia bisporula]|uniref:Uncharacterized protein n=1 Tax=Trichodelitschia bisporula TaxID=703511 RepID=A0A6G1HSK5_9PEZI|nr:hypothetical protein EJ06DRAFT_64806 [Trichodelitschia bisporula]